MIWLINFVLVFVGCGSAEVEEPPRDFPESFIWGTATAGFQVDMGCPSMDDSACIDDASDWYQWVTEPEVVNQSSLYISGDDVRLGPGMWELFEEDVARMKSDGMTQYRFSLEWSRLFPEAPKGTGMAALKAAVNMDAVTRYHEMFAALGAAGIAPMVTLNHYTLPLWVHDGVACNLDMETCTARGWVDEEWILPLVTDFAAFCAAEFGGEVDGWATLNEPMATALSGYLFPGSDRSAPPGLSMSDMLIPVIQNQIIGHAAMYDAVIANDVIDADGDGTPASVGLVLNMTAIETADPTDKEAALAVEHCDYIYHRLFLDGITAGAWDLDFDGVPDETREDLKGRLDWLGVNYYNRLEVSPLPSPLYPAVPISDFFPFVSWDPYPEGLTAVLVEAAEYGVPLYITENGTPHVDGDEGVEILEGHLTALAASIANGIDVRGYYYWSFVDNYEWNHGMDMTFGLYELNLETKERTARPVLERYREIVSTGRL